MPEHQWRKVARPRGILFHRGSTCVVLPAMPCRLDYLQAHRRERQPSEGHPVPHGATPDWWPQRPGHDPRRHEKNGDEKEDRQLHGIRFVHLQRSPPNIPSAAYAEPSSTGGTSQRTTRGAIRLATKEARPGLAVDRRSEAWAQLSCQLHWRLGW